MPKGQKSEKSEKDLLHEINKKIGLLISITLKKPEGKEKQAIILAQAGLSYKDVAEILGTSESYIQNLMSGKKKKVIISQKPRQH